MNTKKTKEESFLTLLEVDENFINENDRVKALLAKIDPILSEGKKLEKKQWILTAKTAREDFTKAIDNSIAELIKKFGTRQELINAIKSGVLGDNSKMRFQTQFRNRSECELSDSDLQNILGDQEILKLLQENDERKK